MIENATLVRMLVQQRRQRRDAGSYGQDAGRIVCGFEQFQRQAVGLGRGVRAVALRMTRLRAARRASRWRNAVCPCT